MTEFRFATPWWWLALIPLIILAWVLRRRSQRGVLLYSSTALLRDLPWTLSTVARRVLPWLHGAGILLLVIALARPQFGEEEFSLRAEGIAIEMCIDRSGSMLAHDFIIDAKRLNRLQAVKQVFVDFVTGGKEFSGRTNDLIGLIAFGGFADARCPLTLDHGTLLDILQSVEVAAEVRDRFGRIINEALLEEERATAIGDALALAVDRLRDIQAKSKIAILLSDGENTAGAVTPEDAAKAAKEFGIKVYSIGVGTTGMAPFPVVDRFGREHFVAQPVSLDETTLRMIADQTGGKYFAAQDATSLEQVYHEIDQLEKSETTGRIFLQYRELFPYLLTPACALIMLSITLRATWLRTLP